MKAWIHWHSSICGTTLLFIRNHTSSYLFSFMLVLVAAATASISSCNYAITEARVNKTATAKMNKLVSQKKNNLKANRNYRGKCTEWILWSFNINDHLESLSLFRLNSDSRWFLVWQFLFWCICKLVFKKKKVILQKVRYWSRCCFIIMLKVCQH